MSFAWPLALLGLLCVPLLIALYIWLRRRRRKFAVTVSSLSLIREALPERSRWRQHLPFAVLLAAMSTLVLGLARPQATVLIPLDQTSIVLALDVSTSMCSTDVDPNRLAAAQEAAAAFVAEQSDGTRIGIVAFSDSATIVVAPTTDKELLTNAIEGFKTSRGTAIGSATLKAVDAIAELNERVVPAGLDVVEPLPEGEFVSDIIVLLTDGAVSAGVDPIIAAEQAAQRGVRVFTVGFGTDNPQQLVCSPDQLGTDQFGQGFGAGGFPPEILPFLLIDEDTLQEMSSITGGEYSRAQDADQLLDVFLSLPSRVELQEEDEDLSVAFAAAGAILTLLAVGLSLRWNRFP